MYSIPYTRLLTICFHEKINWKFIKNFVGLDLLFYFFPKQFWWAKKILGFIQCRKLNVFIQSYLNCHLLFAFCFWAGRFVCASRYACLFGTSSICKNHQSHNGNSLLELFFFLQYFFLWWSDTLWSRQSNPNLHQ